MTESDRSHITDLIDQYRTASRHLRNAQAAHDAARDEIHRWLEEMGRMYIETGERQIDMQTARYLYWELPKIHAKQIGVALGVPTTDVHKVVNSEPYIVSCQDCGKTLELRPKSRTGYNSDTAVCGNCMTKRWQQDDEELKRSAERKKRAREHRVALIRAGGYWIDSDGEIVAQGMPHWCHGCGGDAYPTYPETSAWTTGALVTFVCHWCRTHQEPWSSGEFHAQLVTYVLPIDDAGDDAA